MITLFRPVLVTAQGFNPTMGNLFKVVVLTVKYKTLLICQQANSNIFFSINIHCLILCNYFEAINDHRESKAAAHVAVDLQCWHCKALE